MLTVRACPHFLWPALLSHYNMLPCFYALKVTCDWLQPEADMSQLELI